MKIIVLLFLNWSIPQALDITKQRFSN